jgi:hypothetical protein
MNSSRTVAFSLQKNKKQRKKRITARMAATFSDVGIQKVVSRYKCLSSQGDYVDKQPTYAANFCM